MRIYTCNANVLLFLQTNSEHMKNALKTHAIDRCLKNDYDESNDGHGQYNCETPRRFNK